MTGAAMIDDKDFPGKPRLAGLDELRGLATLWVMWCHSASLWTWVPPGFGGYGYHGVVLFFIISGFLITRILMKDEGQPLYFCRFYMNRIFRIWPLMLVALALSGIVWSSELPKIFYNFLMINNYAYAYGIEPMVRTDVMWSLAIEEQFYLLWPAVFFLVRKERIGMVIFLVILAGLLFDSGLIYGGAGPIFKKTHGAMHYIAMGTAFALGARTGLRVLLAAWGVFLLWYALAHHGDFSAFRWYWHGITLALALLVYATIHLRPLIRAGWLAAIGKRCYGAYLIHFFVSSTTLKFLGSGSWLPGVTFFAASLALTWISFRYFEWPVLQLRERFIASDRLKAALFGVFTLLVLISVVMLIPRPLAAS
jgi:peptidoglycan/LPS O-acetylase OafA/YrhL